IAYLAMVYAWAIGVPTISAYPWLYATYMQNSLPILRMPDGQALSHFWTLAVEEHFYAIWPFFVLFAPRRWWTSATVAVVVTACAARIATASIWNPFVAYEKHLVAIRRARFRRPARHGAATSDDGGSHWVRSRRVERDDIAGLAV